MGCVFHLTPVKRHLLPELAREPSQTVSCSYCFEESSIMLSGEIFTALVENLWEYAWFSDYFRAITIQLDTMKGNNHPATVWFVAKGIIDHRKTVVCSLFTRLLLWFLRFIRMKRSSSVMMWDKWCSPKPGNSTIVAQKWEQEKLRKTDFKTPEPLKAMEC